MMSVKALTAAVQLMYATTYTSGCFSFHRASAFASQESASEQPASRSGSSTVLPGLTIRSEEHTSELQSLTNLVCRLLLEKKKQPAPEALQTLYNCWQTTPRRLAQTC